MSTLNKNPIPQEKTSTKKVQDLAYGKSMEQKILDSGRLQKLFGKLTPTDAYCEWDFESDKYRIELKCRSFVRTAYDTTMFGYNKTQIKHDKPLIVVFGFQVEGALDKNKPTKYSVSNVKGLWYYEWNEQKTDEYIVRKGGRRDRGYDEIKDYVFVKIQYLKPIP